MRKRHDEKESDFYRRIERRGERQLAAAIGCLILGTGAIAAHIGVLPAGETGDIVMLSGMGVGLTGAILLGASASNTETSDHYFETTTNRRSYES